MTKVYDAFLSHNSRDKAMNVNSALWTESNEI
jgi:hypothetical protein